MPIGHWMMFGTFAEQRHFVYPSVETYQGVVINANMAAHAPDGLAAFLVEKTANLHYVIDPLTHAFQHDPDYITGKDGEAKSSIKSLAEAYGQPIAGIVGRRPLLPEDLADDGLLSALVKNCLDFQNNKLAEMMATSDAMKYLDVENEDLRPYALIAPYFYLTETTYEDWLPVAVRAIRFARDHYREARLFASVVVSQGVILDSEILDHIVEAFNAERPEGYFLWVDNLDEQQSGVAELSGFLKIARGLRGGGARGH